jgi:hypothetical protein
LNAAESAKLTFLPSSHFSQTLLQIPTVNKELKEIKAIMNSPKSDAEKMVEIGVRADDDDLDIVSIGELRKRKLSESKLIKPIPTPAASDRSG